MDKVVAVTVLADLFGVDRRTISALAKRGIVVRRGSGYAHDESVRRYCAHLRELATGRGGDTAIARATVERARLLKEQADAVALKNATLRGEMLDAAAVEREWTNIVRAARAGCLAIPSRVQQRLPHLTKHDAAVIDLEVRGVLEGLADGD